MSTAAIADGRGRHDLAHLVLVAGVAALVVVLYLRSFLSIAALWHESDYRVGILVFPVAAYILWRRRASLAQMPLKPWAPGLLGIVILVLGWAVSQRIGVQVTEQLCAVLLIPAAVATFLGIEFLRRSLFPLLFLVAAVPVGDGLVPYLMRFTADASTALLRATGVPVFREGQLITLPGGNFEVVAACGGMHYLVSGIIVALLFSYLTYRRIWKRVVFIMVAAATLVMANSVRAFIAMYVASATHMRYLTGRDHFFFGWLLFGVVVVALFWVSARFADGPAEEGRDAPRAREARGRYPLLPLVLVLGLAMLAGTARPLQSDLGNTAILLLPASVLLVWILHKAFVPTEAAVRTARFPASPYANPAGLAVVLLSVCALSVGPALARLSRHTSGVTGEVALPAVPGCQGPAAWSQDWRPRLESPDFFGAASYSCSEQTVDAFVAGYLSGEQGREVGNDDRLLPKSWFDSMSTSERPLKSIDGLPPEVKEAQVNGNVPILIWYWYNVGDKTALSPIGVKLLQGYQLISAGDETSSVRILVTTVHGDLESARHRLMLVAESLATAATGKAAPDSASAAP